MALVTLNGTLERIADAGSAIGSMVDNIRSMSGDTRRIEEHSRHLDSIDERLDRIVELMERMVASVDELGSSVAELEQHIEPVGRLAGRLRAARRASSLPDLALDHDLALVDRGSGARSV